MRLREELKGTVACDSGQWKLVLHTLPVCLPCALVVISAMGNDPQGTDTVAVLKLQTYIRVMEGTHLKEPKSSRNSTKYE